MPQVIWKFAVPISVGGTTRFDIDLQEKATPLFIASDEDDALWLWVKLDPAEKPENRKFALIGTGYWLPGTAGMYVGSAILHGCGEVYHLFEEA